MVARSLGVRTSRPLRVPVGAPYSMPRVSAGPTISVRSLVIPMYDEGTRIGRTIAALADSPLRRSGLELVLVDDGSSDDTSAIASGALSAHGLDDSQVVRLERNMGKGAAVRAGMLAARGETRVFVDADLCVDTTDIERCFEEIEQGRADVVYGTRAHPASSLERSQPAHRVLSGRTFNLLLRTLGLTDERDTQCGLKGFRASAAEDIFGRLVTERFAFDVEVLARAGRSGLRVVPLPVQWAHVDASRVRPVRDGVDMARAAIRIRRQLDREVAAETARTDTDAGTESCTDSGTDDTGGMDAGAIEAMAVVERTHWWFRAKRDLVIAELGRRRVAGTVVDVGAGTGGLLDALRGSGRAAVGVELDTDALRLSTRFVPRPSLAQAVAERVPVGSGRAAAVTCLDVLEHLDDDVAGFRELARVAGPGGLVVVAVPAYRWAWSEHDVRLGHRRRYDRAALVAAARSAEIDVIRCTHFHGWLTPVAFLLRRTPLRRLVDADRAEEASFVSPTVNRLLSAVGWIERAVLSFVDLPFGLSILLVGRVSGSGGSVGAPGPAAPTT